MSILNKKQKRTPLNKGNYMMVTKLKPASVVAPLSELLLLNQPASCSAPAVT